MGKSIQKLIKEKAEQLVREFNPYKHKAIKYYVGSEPRYIYCGEVHTEKEIDEAYLVTAIKDMTNGYNERMVGYYDKWYRVNHADEGRAYDKGVQMAIQNSKCPCDYHIIECMG